MPRDPHPVSLLSPASVLSIIQRVPIPPKIHVLHAQVCKDLGPTVSARNPAHLTMPELQLVLEYKLSVGHRRPFLPALLRKNDAETVETVTTRALAIPDLHVGGWQAVDAAMKILCELKAVGPAMASLVLSIVHPAEIAFFSDEAALELLPLSGGDKGLKYTMKEYDQLYQELGRIMEVVNTRGESEESKEDGKDNETRKVGRGDIERAVWVTVRERSPTSTEGNEKKGKRKRGDGSAETTKPRKMKQ